MLGPGVLLGNRYRLEERIAQGGMGDVWRGTDDVLGRTVAVKILLPALLDEPGFAERFRGEARTMATINHPGVVDIYDYGSDHQLAFLVMEYVEGDALSRTLARVGRLTPGRTMALVAQAADALHAAHQKGIVHRDVKPGNLLVRPNGTLVLTDFGIARSAMVGQLTAVGSVLGTASYISPEQATGAAATAASDIYALGIVAYQCLSGRRPFDGDSPLEISMKHVREAPRPLPNDIPPAVRSIVDRAMAKHPAARWPTAAALAAVARQAAAALVPPAWSGASARHPNTSPGTSPTGPSTAGPGSPAAAPPHIRVSPPHPPSAAAPARPVPPAVGSGRPAARAAVPSAANGLAAGTHPRGAAPAAGPGPTSGYGPPPSPGRSGGSSSRSLLIMLLVVLALVVLLCSLSMSNGNGGGSSGASAIPTGVPTVTVSRLVTLDRDDSPDAPYRRVERPAHAGRVATR